MADDADDQPEVEPTFIDPARRSERGQLRDALPPESRVGNPPTDESDMDTPQFLEIGDRRPPEFGER